jgi:hypothetical protein
LASRTLRQVAHHRADLDVRSNRSVAPTLNNIMVSVVFESSTITCSRRNRSASGMRLVAGLMIGRDLVVADETPSEIGSAPWLMQYTLPRGLQHLSCALR